MRTRWQIVALGVVIAVALELGSKWQTMIAAPRAPTSVSQRTHNLAAGEAEVKRLLLLMDKDKNGKISRQESMGFFMDFMDGEFERLDTDKTGELDATELLHFRFRVR